MTPGQQTMTPQSQLSMSFPDHDVASTSCPAVVSPVAVSSNTIGDTKIKKEGHAVPPATKFSSDESSSSASASAKIQQKQRPSPEECLYVVNVLGKLHPNVLKETEKLRKKQGPQQQARHSVLDGVVSTMLSQNTTKANSTKTFSNLKTSFPTWNDAVNLGEKNIKPLEDTIRVAGMAKIRAKRILNLCSTLQEEQGSPSLEYLRDWSNDDISKDLIRFPGLGKKTISCVLLFTLGREDFPVDTHVHRITKQLKWIPNNCSRDDAYEYLNAIVPPPLKWICIV